MIIAYTGLPGGGKSLSALSDYVLPELRRGRHVFCNIVGLSPMLIASRLGVNTPYISRYLHRFSMSFSDDIAAGEKVYRKQLPDGSAYYANAEGLALLVGDILSFKEKGSEPVVILDECHEYLNAENWKLLRPFAKYISYARHYGHDLVLITQHITDIWEPLQRRIHETHNFVRGRFGIKAQYMEQVYHGCNVRAAPGYVKSRVNDKSLYQLYKSHDGGAKEHLGYVSIWKSKKLVATVAAIFLLLFSSAYIIGTRGIFGDVAKRYDGRSSSSSPLPAPEHSQSSNVIYVKYVVCGAVDCKATRPDGSTITLPLDYASGKYPIEVRKYVPSNSNPFGFGLPAGNRPGVPHAPR